LKDAFGLFVRKKQQIIKVEKIIAKYRQSAIVFGGISLKLIVMSHTALAISNGI